MRRTTIHRFLTRPLLELAGVLLLFVATGAAAQNTSATLAWQRTDRYCPPDAGAYFPEDAAGGRKLEALFQAVDKESRPDAEILATVRQGLRASQSRMPILRWIGNKYIWGKKPQNPQAIELMYHATQLDQGAAIYFGLSVTQPKTPAILHTLAEIGMKTDDPNDLHRIAWGCADQQEELLGYVTPFLTRGTPEARRHAEDFSRMIRGELKAFEWAAERGRAKAHEQFGGRLPELREQLLKGDTQARQQALKVMNQGAMALIDDTFAEPFAAAAQDPDPKLRAEVARMAGNALIWSAGTQNPPTIELMLRLSRDEDREVRNRAIYFGLSTVREKNEAVLRRLIELALGDHEWNNYGRCVWGLGFSMRGPARETIGRILKETLDTTTASEQQTAAAGLLYQSLFKAPPPNAGRISAALKRYPEDLFVVPIQPAGTFKPAAPDELWQELEATLPAGIQAGRMPKSSSRGMTVKVQGAAARDALRAAIAKNPRLRQGEAAALTPEMQLYLEERNAAPGRE